MNLEKMVKLISTVQAHPKVMTPGQIEEWINTLRTLNGVRISELTANTVKRCKESNLRCMFVVYFSDIAEMTVILDRLDNGRKEYSVSSDVFFYRYFPQNNMQQQEEEQQQQQHGFMNNVHERHLQEQFWQQQHSSLMNHIHEHQRFVHEHMHQHHVMLMHRHHHNF